MKDRKISGKSLVIRIGFILILVWLLLFAAIFVNNVIYQNGLTNEIRNTNQNMLDLYVSQIDNQCKDINLYLANDITLSQHDSSSVFAQTDGEYDYAGISKKLSEDLLLYGNNFSFFFVNPADAKYILSTASNILIREHADIMNILGDIQSLTGHQDWFVQEYDGHQYLMRFYFDDFYIGSWISLDNALALYSENNFSPATLLLFADSENILARQKNKTLPEGLTLQNQSFSRDFMMIESELAVQNLRLVELLPYSEILSSQRNLNNFYIVFMILLLLLMPVLFKYFSVILFKPLRRLTSAMDSIKAGNLDVTLTKTGNTDELVLLTDTFNEMTSEIKNLKIDIYEQKFYSQKLELERLEQQVKPHFYLNCLNIIYNLAQAKDYALIQELTMAQVKYFRYMLKSHFSLVKIAEEFAHIENYLHVQQLRYPGRLETALELHSAVENALIPPLTLQTFVENATQHALTGGQILKVRINVIEEDENSIRITILDDGPGFPKAVLAKIYQNEPLADNTGKHIGIQNTMQRLKLFYNGQARITISNVRPHGSRVEIIIPKRFKKEEES